MKKIMTILTFLAIGLIAFIIVSHNNQSAEIGLYNTKHNIDLVNPQFSWNVVVDESSCDNHMCGTDLSLNYSDKQFRLGKFGNCDADVKYQDETYGNLLEYNKYSSLPAENEMVTYKNCPVMGGGALFYVTDNGDEYRVMKKIYGDGDYTNGSTDSEFMFAVKK